MEDDFLDDFSYVSNVTGEIVEMIRELEIYIVPPFIVLFHIVGLIGNFALVYILLKPSTQRNTTNIFIFNLAVADLMVLLFYLPLHDIYLTYFRDVFATLEPASNAASHLTSYLNMFALGVSAFTLTAMSAHSCCKATTPTPTPTPTLQSGREKRNALVSAAVIWGLAVTSSIAMIQILLSLDRERRSHEIAFRCVYMAVFYFVPVTAAVCFLIVARRNARSRDQKENAILVAVLVAVYAVCYLPSHLATSRFIHGNQVTFAWMDVTIIARCLRIAYRCLNPVALYCTSGVFRKLFNRHLFCCCAGKHQEQELVGELELPLRDGAQDVEG